jgi:hypothetical protein
MLAASWSESIGEAPKVLLVNTIEDCDHGLLDNLVFQRRDSQWTLPPISFRNEHSPGWLRAIRAAVNPAVQIDKPIF